MKRPLCGSGPFRLCQLFICGCPSWVGSRQLTHRQEPDPTFPAMRYAVVCVVGSGSAWFTPFEKNRHAIQVVVCSSSVMKLGTTELPQNRELLAQSKAADDRVRTRIGVVLIP